MNVCMIGLLLCLVLTNYATGASEQPKSNVLDECKENIRSECGVEVGNSILQGVNVNSICCYGVVVLAGKHCHNLLIENLASSHPKANKSRILAYGEQVWNQCLAIELSLSLESIGRLNQCAGHFSKKCGEEVHHSIFENGIITNSCCRDLISAGESCHNFLVDVIPSLLQPQANKSKVLEKSKQVWNQCFGIEVSSSKESRTKTLNMCMKHTFTRCRFEADQHIFHGAPITDECCHDLVGVGRSCHDLLVNETLTTDHRNVDKAKVLEDSKQLWNHCSAVEVSYAKTHSKTKPLRNCEENISSECGVELSNAVFQNATLTPTCCNDLLLLGLSCHDRLVQETLKTVDPNVDKANILSKSLQIYNDCDSRYGGHI